jgi:hypothetical protein
MIRDSEVRTVTADIYDEVKRAKSIHTKDFHSVHEGYAVVLEEVDELWEEVKKKNPDKELLKKEATQAAAMLVRFIIELT